MSLIMVLMRFVRRNNMIGFVILGIPLLEGQNTSYVLLSVIGVMVETIAIMVVYSLVIAKKYEEE